MVFHTSSKLSSIVGTQNTTVSVCLSVKNKGEGDTDMLFLLFYSNFNQNLNISKTFVQVVRSTNQKYISIGQVRTVRSKSNS